MKTKSKSQYIVYILKCKDKTLYCGITNDLTHRLAQHNSGKGSAYVRSRGGGKIVYSITLKNKSLALRREAEIKKLTRARKLVLIKDHNTKSK